MFVPAIGDRDDNDLRQNASALFPPEFYLDLLANETVKEMIGAKVRFSFPASCIVRREEGRVGH